MTTPQYVVSGQERRELKGELAQLKHHLKMQPQYLDLCMVYGTMIDMDKEIRWTKSTKKRIESITEQLSKQLIK